MAFAPASEFLDIPRQAIMLCQSDASISATITSTPPDTSKSCQTLKARAEALVPLIVCCDSLPKPPLVLSTPLDANV